MESTNGIAAVVLGCAHLAMCLTWAAVAIAAIERVSSAAWRKWLRGLVFVATVLPNLALAIGAAMLRFGGEDRSAPWLGLAVLCAAQIVGWVALLRLEPPLGVRLGFGATLLAALLATSLEWSALVNLQLRTQWIGARLRFDAGRAAFDRKSAPATVSGAAAEYARIHALWCDEQDRSVFDPYLERLDETTARPAGAGDPEAALDANDEALLDRLAEHAAAFEDLRRAAAAPTAGFARDEQREDAVTSTTLRQLVFLSRALRLDARVRAAQGDASGAWADLEAIHGIARQLEPDALLLSLGLITALRDAAFGEVQHVLAAPGLGADALVELRPFAALDVAELGDRALRLEQLSTEDLIGEALMSTSDPLPWGLLSGGTSPTAPIADLSLRLSLESEIASYRAVILEMRGLCALPAAEAEAGWNRIETDLRRQGVLVKLIVPNFGRLLRGLGRARAQDSLTHAALACARHRVEHGTWPTALSALEPSVKPNANVTLTEDGETLTLAWSEAGFVGDAPTLRLTAR